MWWKREKKRQWKSDWNKHILADFIIISNVSNYKREWDSENLIVIYLCRLVSVERPCKKVVADSRKQLVQSSYLVSVVSPLTFCIHYVVSVYSRITPSFLPSSLNHSLLHFHIDILYFLIIYWFTNIETYNYEIFFASSRARTHIQIHVNIA